MTYIYGVLKDPTDMKGILRRQNSAVPPDSLLDDFAGRIARELWWTNQEFSRVDIVPPSLSILIDHLGDEQWAR
jgi:hypothetical protein